MGNHCSVDAKPQRSRHEARDPSDDSPIDLMTSIDDAEKLVQTFRDDEERGGPVSHDGMHSGADERQVPSDDLPPLPVQSDEPPPPLPAPLPSEEAPFEKRFLGDDVEMAELGLADQDGTFTLEEEEERLAEDAEIAALERGDAAADDDDTDTHVKQYAGGVCVCCINSAHTPVTLRLGCSVM